MLFSLHTVLWHRIIHILAVRIQTNVMDCCDDVSQSKEESITWKKIWSCTSTLSILTFIYKFDTHSWWSVIHMHNVLPLAFRNFAITRYFKDMWNKDSKGPGMLHYNTPLKSMTQPFYTLYILNYTNKWFTFISVICMMCTRCVCNLRWVRPYD